MTRTAESLTMAIHRLREIRKKCEFDISVNNPKELMHAIEAENLILVGEVIARCARLRRETRGSHFRVDYPRRNDNDLLYRIVSRMENGEIFHRPLISENEWIRSYPYEIVHAN